MTDNINPKINQRTLATKVSGSGIGLHSGEKVKFSIAPGEENSGIKFIRTDVVGINNGGFNNEIAANYLNVCSTTLGTAISNDDGTMVSTIEHLMSAFWGCGVDNAVIEIAGPEVPIMDGSAEPFVFLIECAGIAEQSSSRKFIKVLKEVGVKEDNKIASIAPADGFSVNLEIDFDSEAISKQKHVFSSADFSFKTDLCPARTFGFEHEVSKLRSMGLARGGSLENAIVVSGDKVLNKGGLRYKNEFVRHKILDCIGDVYLAGGHFKGAFSGYRSGHDINNKLLRKFFADRGCLGASI